MKIKNIRIQNFVTLKDVTIEFTDKLNVLYGDSGSGKSLIFLAIEMILGENASSKLIRENENKAIIECEIENLGFVQKIIEKTKTYTFLNEKIISNTELKTKINKIKVFTQGSQQEVYDKEFQYELVNQFLRNEEKEVKNLYYTIKNLQKEIEDLKNEKIKIEEKKSFYEKQLKEINLLNPKENEDEELEEKIQDKREKEKFLTEQYIYLNHLKIAKENLKSIENFKEKEEILDFFEKYEKKILSSLDEYNNRSDVYVYGYSLSKRSLRLDNLKKKLKKSSIKEVLEYKSFLENELKKLENSDETIHLKENELKKITENFYEKASDFHKKQNDTLKDLLEKSKEYLYKLDFSYIDFQIVWNPLEKFSERGFNDFEIYVSLNKGFSVKPLKEIVSGGEASRLALVFNILSNKNEENYLLLLDEVDVGLSGESLKNLSEMLKNINSQIICISHSKEIIDSGNKKIYIFKEEKNGKTETKVQY